MASSRTGTKDVGSPPLSANSNAVLHTILENPVTIIYKLVLANLRFIETGWLRCKSITNLLAPLIFFISDTRCIQNKLLFMLSSFSSVYFCTQIEDYAKQHVKGSNEISELLGVETSNSSLNCFSIKYTSEA
jgi:hypothetical protein